MTISIKSPGIGEPDFSVVIDGSGPTGHICACGKVDDPSPVWRGGKSQRIWDERDWSADPIKAIYARIHPGHLLAGDVKTLPPHPPASDTLRRVIVGASPDWHFDDVPNASVATTPGAKNTLVIWAEFTTVPEISTFQHFSGVAAAKVKCDCDRIGSGMPYGPPPAAKAKPTVALAMAPLVWHLLANGFSAASSLFNGSWSLSLRQTIGGQCVWDNGGNGTSVPLVELRCESPLSQTWQLAFRYKGLASPKYERPAIEWNTLKPNTIFVRTDNGVDLKTVPQSLTILPG